MSFKIDIARLLKGMIRIRIAEEAIADIYPQGEMRTPTHFAIGQEAPAVGVCAALETSDVIYSGHRCHAHYLAKGGSLDAMVAELFGRAAGCAGGRGGSVHLTDLAAGVVASSAILGETMAAATGSALSFVMDRLPRVAVTFFGDGCVEEGIFHETLNFAVVKKVPVVFVCENNLYSTHTGLGTRQPAGISITERAKGYGMPAEQVDGNDVQAVYAAAKRAVEHARKTNSPYFLECMTYRWREHVGPLWDHDRGYRTKEEVDSWMARCPIKKATADAVAQGACTPADVEAWHASARTEVEAAIQKARLSPFPSAEQLLDGTY
jgi:TPP-dependent pyruvate/acetoin dehydrogenase alpha subunit